jgi:hypothetical protein
MIDEAIFNNNLSFLPITMFIVSSYIAGFFFNSIGNLLLKLVKYILKKFKKTNKKNAVISSKSGVKKLSDFNQGESTANSGIGVIPEEGILHRKIISKSEKYVLIRENAKENQKFIELWNTMKNLCASLSLIILILAVYFYIKFSSFSIWFLIGSILLGGLLLFRAMEYGRWAMIDLDNAYEKIIDKNIKK